MDITLHIPDSIARSLRIPKSEAEERLRLTHWNIARHYGEEELTEDLKYAGGE